MKLRAEKQPGMRRWFLSYNSQDLGLMQSLEAALRRKDPQAHVYFAPKSERGGGFWLPSLANEIADATVFVLFLGEKGIGPWQVLEYNEALARRVKEPAFPLVPVVLDGQPAPGLPFLRQLHWIVTADPTSENSLALLMDAAAGGGSTPRELWRHTAPYRGLAAMTEADSDYFFGRSRETIEAITVFASEPDKLPVLIGNSGVGKSSLAQAGVVAALIRQAWPETTESPGAWPQIFNASRRWCFLRLTPGAEPLRALVESFLDTWQFGSADPERVKHRNGWISLLNEGEGTLHDLLDATERRYKELALPNPPAFMLYVDQGEELYIRAEESQRRRFSEMLAQGVADPRLYALMSLRADFFGELQKDTPLYRTHRHINVAPLNESELLSVITQPAKLLSVRFETDHLAADIARRTAEDSTEDAGALPLLSYLLDDMWRSMAERNEGILRLPPQSIELGRVLVDRANLFLARHPNSEDTLRRIFTLKLATVREDGELTRRRAWRAEFSDEEWRLVSELADHPNRLLVTATTVEGETYTEAAHEAIFRRWQKLQEWIATEREFLAWRSSVEHDRQRWEAAPAPSKRDALLMGLALAQAQGWLQKREADLSPALYEFVTLSVEVEAQRRDAAQQLEILRIRAEEEVARLRAEKEAREQRLRADAEAGARQVEQRRASTYLRLSWAIVGGVLLLFTNLNAVLRLSDWVRFLVDHSLESNQLFWIWVFGWFGVKAPREPLILLVFTVILIVVAAYFGGGAWKRRIVFFALGLLTIIALSEISKLNLHHYLQ